MIKNKIQIIGWSNLIVYLIVLAVLSFLLFYFKPMVGGVAIAITLILFLYTDRLLSVKAMEFEETIEDLNKDFDQVTHNVVFHMPFPIAMLNGRGQIKWYNHKFKSLFNLEELLGCWIEQVLPGFPFAKVIETVNPKPIELDIKNNHYQFYFNYVEQPKTEDDCAILLYGVNKTEDYLLSKAYEAEALNIAIVHIDNYDDVRNSTEESMRPLVFAEIDHIISEYAAKYHTVVRKCESDEYMMLMEKQWMEEMKKNRFSVLDRVREMKKGNAIQPTLSIGIGTSGKDPLDTYQKASVAVDVALGRGGDQAVIKDGEDLKYYGGKTKAAEKRNKVKARVIAQALAQLIDQSSEVFIMGHRYPDMDAFGSALGILSAVKDKGKNAYLVLNGINLSIENIYNKVTETLEDFEKYIITSEEAGNICTRTSLVIILDTHRYGALEAPALLDITKRIVIIDHHRRSADYITDPTLIFLEPYASSTAELVTEILSYMNDKLNLEPVVAEALLAGITVDTKNFFYQSGVRTFEAASLLKRQGADSTEIKQLFRDEFDTIRYKADVISSARIYKKRIAIGVLRKELAQSTLIAAKAADELLNIKGIDASFVLTQIGEKTHISGRSLGKISVQLILEKLGGGGHLSAAATQLKASLNEAQESLKTAIDEYFKEEENETDTVK